MEQPDADEADFQAVWTPVKAHLCKNLATSILNKLFMAQAFHNGIDFSAAFAPGKLSVQEDGETPTIATAQDRNLAIKAFQKHLQTIFGDLGSLVQEKDLEAFLAYLGENAKNLAVRLGKQGSLDKKVERALRLELQAQEKAPLEEWLQLVAVSPGVPSADNLAECQKMALHALNLTALQMGRFLGLQDVKEWAIRLMANVVSMGQAANAGSGGSVLQEDKLEAIQNLLSLLYNAENRATLSKADVANVIRILIGQQGDGAQQ